MMMLIPLWMYFFSLEFGIERWVTNTYLMIKHFYKVLWNIDHVIVLWWGALGSNLGATTIFIILLLSWWSLLGDTSRFIWSASPPLVHIFMVI